MSERDRKRLKEIQTFPALVKYLREDLGWPVEQSDFDEYTFDWGTEELGIDPDQAAKIDYIKQLRPLENGQPQGVFFVKFNNKNLPVVALRRLLGKLVVRKRATAAAAERPLWEMRDLVFISSYGESDERQLSFAYFQEPEHKNELPSLKVLGWDDKDTPLHLDRVHDLLESHLTWPESPKALQTWRKGWSAAFELKHGQVVSTAKELADQLAALARGIRERANQLLKLETENGPLRTLMAGFKTALIHDLTEDQFADMYAQTIAYGLLSARITHPEPVKAETLPDLIPVTNPFLKELMETFVLAGGKHRGRKRGHHLDFDELGINEVIELLRSANMNAVLRNFGADDRREDPVTYFYEDFLNAYDAQERKRRGVYYTPKPVVSYIVRSVHELLQTEFGIEDGLASTITWGEMAKRHKDLKIPAGVLPSSLFVQILDPATGTATFLVTVIEIIFDTLTARWKKEGLSEAKRVEGWNAYVPKHLLPRLYGYELMMAPYAIAHLKLGLKLFETGYRFESDERARIYLTNALEPASDDCDSQIDALSEALAHEANAVNEVKRERRFLAVIGNPPYSGRSSNVGEWAAGLTRDYYFVDGAPLGERNPKWLQDDYVKFVRLGQFHVEQAGVGILAFITNHGYLENPTFRGMRRSMMRAFPVVRLLDLHGNSKKGEEAPNNIVDENIFDIQQGVSIGLFSRIPESERSARVEFSEMWGLRADKYRALNSRTAGSISSETLAPVPSFFMFRPQNAARRDEYQAYSSLTDVMPVSSVGFVTSRDDFVIAFDKEDLVERFGRFRDLRVPDATIREQTAVGRLDVSVARKEFRSRKDWGASIVQCQYRPFDYRYVCYADELLERPRRAVMRHLLEEKGNLAMISARSNKAASMDHFFCSRVISETKCGEASTQSCVFPLFLHDCPDGLEFENSRRANFSDQFMLSLRRHIEPDSRSPEAITVFSYLYSVFHSKTYRVRYAEFLKIDFPRIPFPGSFALYRELANIGSDLVALHLLESPKVDDFTTTYIGPKSPEVGRVGWSDDTVWLDAAATTRGQDATAGTMGFRGVPEAVWNFHIGGYQVCEKWLKDRKGRKLLKADIEHYQKIVVALSETIRIMTEIDEVIDQHGGWPGAFKAGRADVQ